MATYGEADRLLQLAEEAAEYVIFLIKVHIHNEAWYNYDVNLFYFYLQIS